MLLSGVLLSDVLLSGVLLSVVLLHIVDLTRGIRFSDALFFVILNRVFLSGVHILALFPACILRHQRQRTRRSVPQATSLRKRGAQRAVLAQIRPFKEQLT